MDFTKKIFSKIYSKKTPFLFISQISFIFLYDSKNHFWRFKFYFFEVAK